MFNHRKREHGQSLVIVALMAVVLIGAVGLAVDGGNTYGQRRIAQNAADAASVAGTYTLYSQNRTPNGRDDAALLTEINRAAEDSGIPDTNGVLDPINDNVFSLFTDTLGNILRENGQDCVVGGNMCPTKSQEAWGVRVITTQSFTTYFASIIGVNNLTVRAAGTAVTHVGANYKQEYFALFADDKNHCGGDAVSVTGSTFTITGNVHSNASAKLSTNASHPGTLTGHLTFKGSASCNPDCDTITSGDVVRLPNGIPNMVYPNFTRISQFVKTQAQGTRGTYYSSTVDIGANQTVSIGSAAKPYTYIEGNLTIAGNANVTLYGAIVVAGNVKIKPTGVTILDPGSSVPLPPNACGLTSSTARISIFASGEIDIQQADTTFAAAPYVDHLGNNILKNNTVMFYSNLNRNAAGAGGNACSTPVIKISSSRANIYGSVVAPFGKVDISGSDNVIRGSIIADGIDVSGSTSRILYQDYCFPPQPDWIELIN